VGGPQGVRSKLEKAAHRLRISSKTAAVVAKPHRARSELEMRASAGEEPPCGSASVIPGLEAVVAGPQGARSELEMRAPPAEQPPCASASGIPGLKFRRGVVLPSEDTELRGALRGLGAVCVELHHPETGAGRGEAGRGAGLKARLGRTDGREDDRGITFARTWLQLTPAAARASSHLCSPCTAAGGRARGAELGRGTLA